VAVEILFWSPLAGRKISFVDPEDEVSLGELVDLRYGYDSPEFQRDPTGFMKRIANVSEDQIANYLEIQYVMLRENKYNDKEASRIIDKLERTIYKRLGKLRELFARYPDLRVVYYSIDGGKYGSWVSPDFRNLLKPWR